MPSLIPFDHEEDVVTDTETTKEAVEITESGTGSLTAAVTNSTIGDDSNVTETLEILNLTSLDSNSAYFNHVKWYLYERSGDVGILISGSTATTTACKAITVPRNIAGDGIVPKSVTGTFTHNYVPDAGSLSGNAQYFRDQEVIKSRGTPQHRGILKRTAAIGDAASGSSTAIGDIFYEAGVCVFRGNQTPGLSGFIDSSVTSYFATDNSTNLSANIIAFTEFDMKRKLKHARQQYFCIAKPRQFNFSQNPTFHDDDGNVVQAQLDLASPKTFITTVGLYGPTDPNDPDSLELLAVAKITPPQSKSFNDSRLFRVQLRF